jgi:hypothetical protein
MPPNAKAKPWPAKENEKQRHKAAATLTNRAESIGPILFLGDEPLRAHVLGVDVDAGLGVVDEIPTGVVGVIVDDEVVARAVPAPAGGEVPVPRSDFKREAAREPEAARDRVHGVSCSEIRRRQRGRVLARRAGLSSPNWDRTKGKSPAHRPISLRFHREYQSYASWCSGNAGNFVSSGYRACFGGAGKG